MKPLLILPYYRKLDFRLYGSIFCYLLLNSLIVLVGSLKSEASTLTATKDFLPLKTNLVSLEEVQSSEDNSNLDSSFKLVLELKKDFQNRSWSKLLATIAWMKVHKPSWLDKDTLSFLSDLEILVLARHCAQPELFLSETFSDTSAESTDKPDKQKSLSTPTEDITPHSRNSLSDQKNDPLSSQESLALTKKLNTLSQVAVVFSHKDPYTLESDSQVYKLASTSREAYGKRNIILIKPPSLKKVVSPRNLERPIRNHCRDFFKSFASEEVGKNARRSTNRDSQT